MVTKLKNNKLLISMIIMILIIIFISIKVITQSEIYIDKIAYNIIVEQLRNPFLTNIMKTVTKLSNTSFIIFLATFLTLLFSLKWNQKKIAIIIPTSLVLITTMNQGLKFIFQRERPIGYRLININGYSFPSGHAMISMAFYGLLIYIIYLLVKDKKVRNILIGLLCLIIFLIGISRVYLGVHYLSDVLVGYSISFIYLLILIKIAKKNKYFP